MGMHAIMSKRNIGFSMNISRSMITTSMNISMTITMISIRVRKILITIVHVTNRHHFH